MCNIPESCSRPATEAGMREALLNWYKPTKLYIEPYPFGVWPVYRFGEYSPAYYVKCTPIDYITKEEILQVKQEEEVYREECEKLWQS